MKQSVYDLQFDLIDTKTPHTSQIPLCEKAFHFWHNSWLDTYKSLGVGHASFFSDDFLDRKVIVLSKEDEPVALFFINTLQVHRASIMKHSYFKNHPPEVMAILNNDSMSPMMVLSYMTLHPEWRRAHTDVSIPDLLFSLAVKFFKESDCNFLSGYIRTDKSFSESFYRHGATHIATTTAYNVPVDFCLLKKSEATLSSEKGVPEACEHLWNKHIKHNNYQLEVA